MQSLLIVSTLLAVTSGAASHKIVGGHNVSISQRPFQAALLKNGRFGNCGGAIISTVWVLTAAHCVEDSRPRTISFRVGSNRRDRGGQVFKVDKIEIHPSYDDITADYDIAVAHLSAPLKLSLKVRPVTLPEAGTVLSAGTIATTSGWGRVAEGSAGSLTLLAVNVPLIGNEHCKKLYRPFNRNITDRMLCAGFLQGDKDSCGGDSGGPLTVNNPPVLAGIVSWGEGCARAKIPGVYADVRNLRSFIKSKTKI